jgi:dephospho-CoA kinase
MTMLRIGLTGSIAVGKSFVAGVLAELGCHVLDADQTAREVVAPGSEGLSAVVGAFGEGVLQTNGTLDRQQLAALIFADLSKRQLLNSILHPYIIAVQDQQLRKWDALNPQGIAVVDAALMIESGGFKRFDKLIVVHCLPEVQLKRLIVRDNLTPEEAQKRIDSQMPQAAKQKFADYLIDTSAGFESTRNRTGEVYEELCRLKMPENKGQG